MRWGVVLGVCGAWLVVAVVLGSQTALGATLQGNPIGLADALRTSLVNTLPWIAPTLVAIWTGNRFPLTRATWRRALPLHLAMIPVVAWLANLGVVLGFWRLAGVWNGWSELAGQAAFWATIRVHVAALVYGSAVALTQGWAYVRDTRARELRLARLEAQLTRARIETLNSQIRPHFLFNTLHTIGQMWRSGRADDADAMLDHLGALFQRVRSSTDRPAISLDEELSMVEDYLAIERSRFPDRLRTDVRASDRARACAVPPLLLQPLVENAIRHGVSASAGAGRVEVTAEAEDGTLVLQVRDDGPGMDHPTPSSGTGTGLENTRERLRHTFGNAQTVRIVSPPDGGTLVRLELPAVDIEAGAEWPGT